MEVVYDKIADGMYDDDDCNSSIKTVEGLVVYETGAISIEDVGISEFTHEAMLELSVLEELMDGKTVDADGIISDVLAEEEKESIHPTEDVFSAGSSKDVPTVSEK